MPRLVTMAMESLVLGEAGGEADHRFLEAEGALLLRGLPARLPWLHAPPVMSSSPAVTLSTSLPPPPSLLSKPPSSVCSVCLPHPHIHTNLSLWREWGEMINSSPALIIVMAFRLGVSVMRKRGTLCLACFHVDKHILYLAEKEEVCLGLGLQSDH